MLKIISIFVASMLLFTFNSAYSEESASNPQGAKESADNDPRQLVTMPEQTRRLMQQEMLDHLSTLNEIIGYLGENNLATAADVAEARLGKSSMGKHRASGMGPGRFMPLEMRSIGWGMHDSATEFSLAAKKGDLKSAYSALQKVTSACVACHNSYRIR